MEGLFTVVAFGTLILSNNDLDWNELQKIRHVHILDLCLHGNPKLEMDAYCKFYNKGTRVYATIPRGKVLQCMQPTQKCTSQKGTFSLGTERPVDEVQSTMAG